MPNKLMRSLHRSSAKAKQQPPKKDDKKTDKTDDAKPATSEPKADAPDTDDVPAAEPPARKTSASPEEPATPKVAPTPPVEKTTVEAVGPASLPTIDPETSVKLRSLEERVNELKEKIFRSKARLVLLQEAVLHGTITGARAVIVHKNEMSGSFKLEEVQYAFDGAPLFTYTATENDPKGRKELESDEFEIFNGSIVPGSHQISVYLVYRGNGYGVFSYLSQYRFPIKSSYTFTVEEGKQTTVKIVGFEKGGLATELKDRPNVRYDVEVSKELRAPKATPPPAAKGK